MQREKHTCPRSAEASNLNDYTESKDRCTSEHHLATTEFVSEHEGEDSSSQTSD